MYSLSGYDSKTGPVTGTTGSGFTLASLATAPAAPTGYTRGTGSSSQTLGGQGDSGYFLAMIADGAFAGSKLTGSVKGRFITSTKMGDAYATTGSLNGTGINGDLLGTYDTADKTWHGVSLGSWNGIPLAFDGESENYYYNGFGQYLYPRDPSGTPLDSLTHPGLLLGLGGSLQGLIGGTETLFGAFNATLGNYPAVTVAGIGIYSNPEKGPLSFARFNGKDLKDTTVANGNALFFGGLGSLDSNGVQRSLAGTIQGLYWKKNPADGKYELGVLSAGSGATATLYPDLASPMWELGAGTTLQAYSIFNGLILAADPEIPPSSLSSFVEGYGNTETEITAGMVGGSWKTWNRSTRIMAIDNLSVRAEVAGGGYNKDVPPQVGSRFSEVNESGARNTVTEITAVDQKNVFDANLVSARSAWDEAGGTTKVWGGVLKGSFDPITATWRAVSLMTGIETKAFLDKISSMNDAQKQAFFDATKIPAFTVGTTDLRGRAGLIDMGSAGDVGKGIVNATFLAPSTGGKPQLWASGNVSGAYTAAPVAGAATVPLTGYQVGTGTANGISANFNIQSWGATKWGATVTGGVAPIGSITGNTKGQTGGVSGNTVPYNFQGGAAGSINSTSGTFAGTAAGIVK